MTRRRRISIVVMVVFAVVPAIVLLVGLLTGGRERIVAYFEVATLSSDGTARVAEVIDYDFGAGSERHGIIRIIPGLTFPSDVAVSSPDAPAQVLRTGNSLRIGDPSITITGAHRYLIGYDIATLVNGDQFAWNVVGDEWDVGIEQVEAHVLSDRSMSDLSCDKGSFGSVGGCEVEQVEPGHLVVRTGSVGSGEAVTVRARLGEPVALPAAPAVPPPAGNTGAPLLLPVVFGFLAALAAALITGRVLRSAGREQTAMGRVDVADLLDDTGPRVAPPRQMTAAQGGVVLTEAVTKQHQAAWLLDQAQHGALSLDGDPDKPTMTWLGGNGANDNLPLREMFDTRPTVELGTYDKPFATGWAMVAAELESWRESSGLWSQEAESRRKKVIGWGVVVLLAGLVATGFLAYRWSLQSPEVWELAALTIPAGVGIGMVLKAWELRVRTPEGSAAYAEVEAFRRFLESAGSDDIEEVETSGVLDDYLAWAVALGEASSWTKALTESGVASRTADFDPSMWLIASSLHSSTSSAATSPSSSGGGGGAGGGGGGGGGGSW